MAKRGEEIKAKISIVFFKLKSLSVKKYSSCSDISFLSLLFFEFAIVFLILLPTFLASLFVWENLFELVCLIVLLEQE